MDFLLFLCQTMKMFEYCEHAANLCVLTIYNLDRFSPCNLFYLTQATLAHTGTDTPQTESIPFLFYANERDTSEKIINSHYEYTNNGTMHHDRDDSVSLKYQFFCLYLSEFFFYYSRQKIV